MATPRKHRVSFIDHKTGERVSFLAKGSKGSKATPKRKAAPKRHAKACTCKRGGHR